MATQTNNKTTGGSFSCVGESLLYAKQPITAPNNQPSTTQNLSPSSSTVEPWMLSPPPLYHFHTLKTLKKGAIPVCYLIFILLPSCLSLSAHEQKHNAILGESIVEKIQ
jgi:hypothetical protein